MPSKEYDRMREAVATLLFQWFFAHLSSPQAIQLAQEASRKVADEILRLPGLRIEADDQSLPQTRIEQFTNPIHPHLVGEDKVNFDLGMEYLQKQGFVKVIEHDKSK